MTIDQFWKLIEDAKAASQGDEGELLESLADALSEHSPEEIQAFSDHLASCMRASCTWPLWGAAYIMNGGCSNDGFDYFRAWLIANGRATFEAAMKDPESLAPADLVFGEDDLYEMESFLYVAHQVFEDATEEEIRVQPLSTDEPAGERWEEDSDDLQLRFPKLWARFSQV
jgi:hypothetical protein